MNIPIRTVLFTQLCKFDGEKTAHPHRRATSTRSPGAPGARASTTAAAVVVQAPEHVDREPQARARRPRAGQEGGEEAAAAEELRGLGPRTPSKRLLAQPPEPLVSRFDVTHGLLLNLLSSAELPPADAGGGYAAAGAASSAAHVSRVPRSADLLGDSARCCSARCGRPGW